MTGVALMALTDTASELTGLGPQLLFAVTVMLPEPFPEVAVILAEVEEPVHPEGRLHV
jgi:hypothetical protein